MAKLSEKKMVVLIAAGALALTGVCGGGVWWSYDLEDQVTANIEEIGKKMQEAKSKIARIPRDEREVIILRENVKEYVKILPEEKELETLTRTVTQFAMQTNVKLKSMTPGNPSGGDRKGGNAFEKVTYKLQLEASLWQFMRFLNCFESFGRFISITAFTLNAGVAVARPVDGTPEQIHSISMDVETYTYNSGGEAAQVKIPGYEKKRSQFREDILKRKADISVEKYTYRDARSRRDIFVDPRVESGPPGPGDKTGLPLNEQTALIERARAEVSSLEEKQKAAEAEVNFIKRFELNKAVKEGLTKLDQKIAEVNDKELLSYRPNRLRFQVEVVQRYETLKKKHTGGPEDGVELGLPMSDLVAARTALEDHLQSGELDAAVERFELTREKLVAPEGDPRHEVEQALRKLYQKAKTGQEFVRKDIRILGMVVVEKGVSGVIINGEIYQEGDSVEDDMFIKSIRRDSVEFLFKGTLIAKKL
jgi:Tfp pilus assembly protein PilO